MEKLSRGIQKNGRKKKQFLAEIRIQVRSATSDQRPAISSGDAADTRLAITWNLRTLVQLKGGDGQLPGGGWWFGPTT